MQFTQNVCKPMPTTDVS